LSASAGPGSILAHELTDEGLDVVAIERGPWRDTATDFPPTYDQDELRYRIRHELFLRPDQTTFTFRDKMDQQALPIRTWGAFMPPNGVGGGGVHWNAETWRFLPSDFVLKTHLTQRYGASFLPPDMTIQDWGVTYDEIELYYDRFEYLCGTSGAAGNLKGQIQEGGNPFEGPRSRPYPTPPQPQPFSHTLFAKVARDVGYKAFPQPSGNLSQPYRNPLGIRLGPCTYCGFCEWFGCGNYSKASPQTTILPVLVRKSNFSARAECEIDILHAPVDEPVRLVMTSQDVIHSFFIPEFRIKQDVLPERYTEAWFRATKTGTFHLFCTAFCGTGHSAMTGTIVVMSKPDFAAWLAAQSGADDLATHGKALFVESGCAGCHTPAGPVHAPDLVGLFGRSVPLADGRTATVDEAYLRDCMLEPHKNVPPAMRQSCRLSKAGSMTAKSWR
jgi:hypothetical protein